MIKAVIFDFGGVVVNESFQEWISSNIAPYASIQHEMIAMQDKVDRGDLPVSAYTEYFAEKTGKNPKEIEKEILTAYVVDKNVVSLIETLLKHGIKTAIVSNFPNEWFSIIRKKLHFEHLFNDIFVSSELHVIKPEAEFFHLVLKKLDIKSNETVFTDDKKRYTDGAEKVGIHGIVFTTAEKLRTDLAELGLPV